MIISFDFENIENHQKSDPKFDHFTEDFQSDIPDPVTFGDYMAMANPNFESWATKYDN